jgi:hypothetical protein
MLSDLCKGPEGHNRGEPASTRFLRTARTTDVQQRSAFSFLNLPCCIIIIDGNETRLKFLSNVFRDSRHGRIRIILGNAKSLHGVKVIAGLNGVNPRSKMPVC